jgi:hypothetical protein
VWARSWADSTWSELDNLPNAVVFGAMAYDKRRQRMVHFGGSGSVAGRVWELEGSDWQVVDPAGGPDTTILRHAMVYDEANDAIVVFGGDTPTSSQVGTANMWIYRVGGDSTPQWTERKRDGDEPWPEARWGHSLAYDSDRERIVLFGGRSGNVPAQRSFNEIWEYDGAWRKVDTKVSPPKSWQNAMDYDRNGRRIIAFIGGYGTYDPHSETWAYAVVGSSCSTDAECSKGTYCVSRVCCESECSEGICNDRDEPGVCKTDP